MASQDGGLAFPRSDGGYAPTSDGMTLRDYFAGQALIAILTRNGPTEPLPTDPYLTVITQTAYLYADGMLRARESQA